ncbi:MAG: hypothetical protein ABR985_22040 [Methanotrichaceae archaeon]
MVGIDSWSGELCYPILTVRSAQIPKVLLDLTRRTGQVQKRLSRVPKWYYLEEKTLKVVQRVHELIANKLYDLAHQVSHDFFTVSKVFIFERRNSMGLKLNI